MKIYGTQAVSPKLCGSPEGFFFQGMRLGWDELNALISYVSGT
jgi:hypothetical protein